MGTYNSAIISSAKRRKLKNTSSVLSRYKIDLNNSDDLAVQEQNDYIKISKDRELEKYEDLHVSRQKLVDLLADAIINIENDDNSTVIGVTGEWGCGKTSIFNAMKKIFSENEKAKNEITTMDFNPWYFENEYSLISAFFEKMYQTIIKVSDHKKVILEDVGFITNLLGKLVGNGWSVLSGDDVYRNISKENEEKFENFKKYGSEDHDIFILRDKLSNYLKELDKKIVIFIDDLDRLTGEQIKLMFKLIKCIADFPNIVYILGYDKKIVSKALADVQCSPEHEYVEEGRKRILNNKLGAEYIKKIIQVEYSVPELSKNELIRDFLEKIIENNKELQQYDYEELIYSFEILKTLRNQRDFNRLHNMFSFEYGIVKEEINPFEFLGLSILKYNYSKIYKLISEYTYYMDNRKNSQSNYEVPQYKEYVEKINKLLIEVEDEEYKEILKNFMGILIPNSIEQNTIPKNLLLQERNYVFRTYDFGESKDILNIKNMGKYFKLNHYTKPKEDIIHILSSKDTLNSFKKLNKELKDNKINIDEGNTFSNIVVKLANNSSELNYVPSPNYRGLMELLLNPKYCDNVNPLKTKMIVDTVYKLSEINFNALYTILDNNLQDNQDKNTLPNEVTIKLICKLHTKQPNISTESITQLNNLKNKFVKILEDYELSTNDDIVYIMEVLQMVNSTKVQNKFTNLSRELTIEYIIRYVNQNYDIRNNGYYNKKILSEDARNFDNMCVFFKNGLPKTHIKNWLDDDNNKNEKEYKIISEIYNKIK
ncbi:KAP family P-loop NTPase fold protein [Methanococcus voltae]|uniref:KAP P-loop domain protein n=1 Tax=Methanococcus voltae (strain ATCC BAA-1334 / A3) TaxID=456320 RepID=D7DS59_METV3|nr:P-loop NTPase fold protein [Methanococcus voltae]MCS3901495.1 energy-coupling factor transporter ATP-binding protein EcfA2 [Methanococcus voltae]